jgi:hypothetical protein
MKIVIPGFWRRFLDGGVFEKEVDISGFWTEFTLVPK